MRLIFDQRLREGTVSPVGNCDGRSRRSTPSRNIVSENDGSDSCILCSFHEIEDAAQSGTTVFEQRIKFFGITRLQVLASRWSDRVLPAPGLCAGRPNPALGLQSRDRAVQRPGAQPDAGEGFDIPHHCVAVFIAFGEDREYEKRRSDMIVTVCVVTYL